MRSVLMPEYRGPYKLPECYIGGPRTMLNASHWAWMSCADLTSGILSDQVNKFCFQSGISYCELYASIRCQRIRIRAPDISRLYTKCRREARDRWHFKQYYCSVSSMCRTSTLSVFLLIPAKHSVGFPVECGPKKCSRIVLVGQ